MTEVRESSSIYIVINVHVNIVFRDLRWRCETFPGYRLSPPHASALLPSFVWLCLSLSCFLGLCGCPVSLTLLYYFPRLCVCLCLSQGPTRLARSMDALSVLDLGEVRH
jgi:hypothetical protein